MNNSNTFSEDQKSALVSTILINADKRSGRRKMIARVPIDLMEVDMTYQREMKNNILVDVFDEDKCAMLTLGHRKGENIFWIIDGQNRAYAALKNGITDLDAEIFEGTTLEEEAEMFAMQNNGTKRLHAYDLFKSNVAAGGRNKDSKTAISVKRLCDKYNVIVDGSKTAGHLTGIKEAQDIVNRSGIDCLEWIFNVISASGWHTKANVYTSRTMSTFESVYNSCPDIIAKRYYHDNISKCLRKTDESEIKSYAMFTYRGNKHEIRKMMRSVMMGIANGAIVYDDISRVNNGNNLLVTV